MNDPGTSITVTELQRQVAALTDTVGKLTDVVGDLRVTVAELRVSVKATACPNPGACVKLEGELVEMKHTVAAIKTHQDQRTGERAVLAIVCTAIGAGIMLAVDKLWVK